MSTRSVIARLKDPAIGTWDGVYCHSDGYPTGNGRTLFAAHNGHFAGDLGSMLGLLIDSHPGGWSYVIDTDFSLEAHRTDWDTYREQPCWICGATRDLHEENHDSYEDRKKWDPDAKWNFEVLGHRWKPKPQPACFCHSLVEGKVVQNRDEPNMQIDQGQALDSDCEWAYVFDLAERTMSVLASTHRNGRKGMAVPFLFSPGNHWSLAGVVRLDGPEPNWTEIECGSNWERCVHLAWKHFPGLQGDERYSRVGMHTYLGREEPDFHEAYGVRIRDREYRVGGGSHEHIITRMPQFYPPETVAIARRRRTKYWRWFGDLTDVETGEQRKLPIARIDPMSDGKLPMRGVEWLFAPMLAQR